MKKKGAMEGSPGSVQKLAAMIARVVVKGLGVSSIEDSPFIFKGDSWMDPGP